MGLGLHWKIYNLNIYNLKFSICLPFIILIFGCLCIILAYITNLLMWNIYYIKLFFVLSFSWHYANIYNTFNILYGTHTLYNIIIILFSIILFQHLHWFILLFNGLNDYIFILATDDDRTKVYRRKILYLDKMY